MGGIFGGGGGGGTPGGSDGQLQYNNNGAFAGTKTIVCDVFTSTGINACIDALGANGGEIYLPEGDYDITATITIDYDNTTIRGAGRGTRLLATNRFVFDAATELNGIIAGETITGGTNGYTAVVAKITYSSATAGIVWYHSLSNGANFADDEVISHGAHTVTVAGTPTTQSFHAIDISTKNNCIISDLQIVGGRRANEDQTKALIRANGGSGGIIDNVYLYKAQYYGIYFEASTTNWKITNNEISFGRPGIWFYSDVYYISIDNNYIHDLSHDAIHFINVYYSTISNNKCTSPDYGSGMSIYGLRYSTLTGNICYSNQYAGLFIGNSSYYSSIVGNICYGNTNAGIYLRSNAHITVNGNTCYSNNGSGITLDAATYSTVVGNTCYNDSVAGINLGGGDGNSSYCLIVGNNLEGETTKIAGDGLNNTIIGMKTGGSNTLMARRFRILETALTDADTSQNIALFTLPAGGLIQDVYAYVTTAFAGGEASAVTVSVGTAADSILLTQAHDVLGTGNGVWILEGQNATDKGAGLYEATDKTKKNYIVTADTALIAQFNSTGDDVADLTAGSIDIYVVYLVPNIY